MSDQNNHYAEIRAADKTWQVYYHGNLLLESDRALELCEHYQGQAMPIVVYFPDLSNLQVSKSATSTHCPIKGEASYWNLGDNEDAIWSYGDPVPAVAAIKGYYGFMQSKGFEIKNRP